MSAEALPPELPPAAPEAGVERREALYRLDVGSYAEKDASHAECEDTITRREDLQLFGVSDGMGGEGGEGAGRKASEFVARSIESSVAEFMATNPDAEPLDARRALRGAFLKARQDMAHADVDGGGTTATFGWVVNSAEGQPHLVIGHAGDTRLSIHRPDEHVGDQIIDLTRDHGTNNGLWNCIIGEADIREVQASGTDYTESAVARRQRRLDDVAATVDAYASAGRGIPGGLSSEQAAELRRLVDAAKLSTFANSFDAATYDEHSFDADAQLKAVDWLDANFPAYPTVKDNITVVPLQPGDRVAIYSDGLTGDWPWQELTNDEKMAGIMHGTPEEAAREFVEISTGPLGGEVEYGTLRDGSPRMVSRHGKKDDKSVVIFDVLSADAPVAEESARPTPSVASPVPVAARTRTEAPAPPTRAPERAARPAVPIRYARLFTAETGRPDPAEALHGIASRIKGYVSGEVKPVGKGNPELTARDREVLGLFLADHHGSELARLVAAAGTAEFTYGKVKYTPDGQPVMVQESNSDGTPKFRSPTREEGAAGEQVSIAVERVAVVPLERGDPPYNAPRPPVEVHPYVMKACEIIDGYYRVNGRGRGPAVKDMSLRQGAARRGQEHAALPLDPNNPVWVTLLGQDPRVVQVVRLISGNPELTYLVEQLAHNVVTNRAKGRIVVKEDAHIIGVRRETAPTAEDSEAERDRRVGRVGLLGMFGRGGR